MSSESELYDFMQQWKPEIGKNHKVDYEWLLKDVPDFDQTHYYLNVDNINDNPSAITKRNDFVPRLYSVQVKREKHSEKYHLLSDRVYLQILINESYNNTKLVINPFYIEGIPLTQDIIQNPGKGNKEIPFHNSNIFSPFLLNNDSLLIYTSGTIESIDQVEEEEEEEEEEPKLDESEAFISLSLFEFKQYDKKINISIGRKVLEQILHNNSFSKNSPNILQFDYKKEDDREIINKSIESHIFKQIIPDPLSKDRFFFIAYKKLYLAEIVGNGLERHLEVFQYLSDIPILMCAISETTIVYCRTNQDGKFVFESVKRTDDVFTNNITQMKEIAYTEIPDSFFIFNDFVYINSNKLLPCIWNLKDNKIKQGSQHSVFQPVSKYYLVTITEHINNDNSNDVYVNNDNRSILTVQNNSMQEILSSKYSEDLILLGNSTNFVLADPYGQTIVVGKPKNSKDAHELNENLFSIDECKSSINAALGENNALITPFKSILQEEDDLYDRIKKITEILTRQ